MSLDISLYAKDLDGNEIEVFSQNLTHNLNKMCAEAGIYEALWRPEELGAVNANDVLVTLCNGVADMKARPHHYRKFDSPNGWGTYDISFPYIEEILNAYMKYPSARIEVSR